MLPARKADFREFFVAVFGVSSTRRILLRGEDAIFVAIGKVFLNCLINIFYADAVAGETLFEGFVAIFYFSKTYIS